MKRVRFTLFSIWLLVLAFCGLSSYPVPYSGALELLRSLAGLGLLLGALLAMGRAILRAFQLQTSSLSQEALFSLALGAMFMSSLVFGLGQFGLLNAPIAWLLLSLFWIPGLRHLEYFFTELRHSLRSKHPWEGSSTEMLALLAAGISAFLVLLLCLAPVTFYDALVYHLALPQRAAASGFSLPLDGNLYSWLPGGAERLWTLCILLDGGGSAWRLAALFNFSLCLALALALTDAGARFLPKSQLWIPAALFLTQPLFALSFGVFGADGIAAFYSFLALSAFLKILEERNLRQRSSWLRLAALLAGFSVAVKPVALIPSVVLLILFAWKAVNDEEERRIGLLGSLAALFLLPLLPWLLRNAALRGDPFMPFGLKILGLEIFQPVSSLYLEHLRGYGSSIHLWALPWSVCFEAKGGAFGGGGHLSFLFFAILPVIFVMRQARELRWLCAYLFFSFLLWSMGPRVLRYAIPALPGLCILTAAGLAEAELWARSRGLSLALRLFVVGALFLGSAQTWVIASMDQDPYRVAFGLQAPSEYLLAHGVNTAKAALWLQEQKPDAHLLVLGDSRLANLPPQSSAYTVFEPNPFKDWLAQAKSPEDLDAILKQKGYDFALCNLAEMQRVNSGNGPHYDYFASPEAEARFQAWLQVHAGKGYSGEGLQLFPLL